MGEAARDLRQKWADIADSLVLSYEGVLAEIRPYLDAFLAEEAEARVAPGVPRLLEHLAAMTGENVHLMCTTSADEWRWRVWTGHPSGSGGSLLGRARTPGEALAAAYDEVVSGIFEGRRFDGG